MSRGFLDRLHRGQEQRAARARARAESVKAESVDLNNLDSWIEAWGLDRCTAWTAEITTGDGTFVDLDMDDQLSVAVYREDGEQVFNKAFGREILSAFQMMLYMIAEHDCAREVRFLLDLPDKYPRERVAVILAEGFEGVGFGYTRQNPISGKFEDLLQGLPYSEDKVRTLFQEAGVTRNLLELCKWILNYDPGFSSCSSAREEV